MNKIETFLATFTLASLLAACGSPEKPTATDNRPTIPVKVAKVQAQNIPVERSYAAQVKAETSSKLSTKIMGTITAFKVEEGQKVSAGQVIAQIKSTDLSAKKAQVKANRREAEAGLANAQKNLERIKTLFSQQSATQKELDDIVAQVEMMEAKIEAIDQMEKEVNEMLNYATITAPFAGTVTRTFMDVGDLASPGMPVVLLENHNEFDIVAKVPESDIAQLQTGQKVSVSVDALGKTSAGKITQINPSGQYGGGQFEITVKLDQPMAKLQNGLFASVKVATGSAAKITVPENVLVRQGQLEGVFALNQQGEAMLRWVRTGKTYNGQIEILSGLNAGDQYIASYEGKLLDGMRVSVKD